MPLSALWQRLGEWWSARQGIAGPSGRPDYSSAQMKERRRAWQEAIDEYLRVHQLHPLDAESLFRVAHIHRDRLHDEDRYLATLQDIVRLPDGASPAWILTEVSNRLLLMGDADPAVGPVHERAAEIELPPDNRKWGRFGPEGQ